MKHRLLVSGQTGDFIAFPLSCSSLNTQLRQDYRTVKYEDVWCKTNWEVSRNVKQYPGTRLEDVSTAMTNPSQNGWTPHRNSNPMPLECEAGMLTSRLQRQVSV